MAHQQTWTKVNAPVDQGVSALVEALSRFHELETVESCQGDQNEGSWVCFRYGRYWEEPWRDLTEFVFGFLAPRLFEKVGDSAQLVLRPRAGGIALADLSIRPMMERDVEAALQELAADFSACQHHNLVSCGDKSDTSLSRC
jgi:hypothetical protein